MNLALYQTDLYDGFCHAMAETLGDTMPCTTATHHIAVACSGGADSLLLTLFTEKYLQEHVAENYQLHALIVDHGLRAEAKIQAQQTHDFLAQHHIQAEILTLPARPTSSETYQNLQHWARFWRYQALQEYCTQHDILFLLLGHHAGDAVEGFWLNLMRGSGIYGLAQMQQVRITDALRIIRPLLALDGAQIRQTLQQCQIPYIHDASNDSEQFKRNSIRKAMPQWQTQGYTHQRIEQTAKHLRDGREVLEAQITALSAEYCHYHPLQFTAIDVGLFSDNAAHSSLVMKILADSIAKLATGQTGEFYPPRYQKLQKIHQRIMAGEKLRGVHIANVNLWHHDDRLFLMPVFDKTTNITDVFRADDANSRYLLCYDNVGHKQIIDKGWHLAWLGDAGIKQLVSAMKPSIKSAFPRILLKQFPAWYDDDALKFVPFISPVFAEVV